MSVELQQILSRLCVWLWEIDNYSFVYDATRGIGGMIERVYVGFSGWGSDSGIFAQLTVYLGFVLEYVQRSGLNVED